MRNLGSIVAVLGLACASAAPIAQRPIDWQAANERWSLHIVTLDPDGGERVTRIWIATVDGEGVLRTGHSRWWQNLERNAASSIRLLGVDSYVTQDINHSYCILFNL